MGVFPDIRHDFRYWRNGSLVRDLRFFWLVRQSYQRPNKTPSYPPSGAIFIQWFGFKERVAY